MVNRENRLKWKRKYYLLNKEKWREYHCKNKAKRAAYKKAYLASSGTATMKAWREANKERVRLNRKAYNEAHRAENAAYMRKRIRQCVNARLRANLRARVYGALFLSGNRKTDSTARLVGCDISYLKLHIQSKFKDGMAWNNYGKLWEIDHIRPCASFNLSDEKERLECFHWSNLQPLWKLQNRSKGSRLNGKLHHYRHSSETTEAPPP